MKLNYTISLQTDFVKPEPGRSAYIPVRSNFRTVADTDSHAGLQKHVAADLPVDRIFRAPALPAGTRGRRSSPISRH
jgi:hypothetical protein